MTKKTIFVFSVLTILFLMICSSPYVCAETAQDYLRKAQEAYSKDKRDTSSIRSYIQKAATQASNDGDWQGLYDAAYWYGKVDSNSDASSCLDKAADIAESKNNVDGLIKISDFYLRLLKNREAEKCVRAAEGIAERNKDAAAMSKVSRQYYKVGNNRQAEKCIDIAANMKTSGTKGSYGTNTTNTGSSGSEATKYDPYKTDKTETKRSTEAMMMADRAYQLYKMNKPMDASSLLRNAEFTAQRQKDAAGMKYVADIYKKMGYMDRAAECEASAQSIDPTWGMKNGTAKKETKITLTNPGWKTELDNAGKYLKENRRGLAYDSLSRAKQAALDVRSVSGLISTGDYYNYAGGKAEASGCYQKAKELAITLKDSASLKLLSDKFRQMGNTPAADQCLKAAQEMEKK